MGAATPPSEAFKYDDPCDVHGRPVGGRSHPAGARRRCDPDRDKVICRKMAVSGTRFAKKVCYTKAEMSERRTQDRQTLEKVQQQGAESFN